MALKEGPRSVARSAGGRAQCDLRPRGGGGRFQGVRPGNRRRRSGGAPTVRRRYADVLEAKIGWRPADPYHLFAVDIGDAAYIVFGRERFAMRWTPTRGFRRWPLPAE
ncbi:MAG TPA: hypothetical protein VK201_00520 [bacterium]|nr:hypothetical protein [bacterium]